MADDTISLIEALGIDLDGIVDPNMRRCIVGLLNIVQQQSAQIARLREEKQKLKDEIGRLKGEQGKPVIKPGKKGSKDKNISSESERKQPKEREPRSRKIEADRGRRECLGHDAVVSGDGQEARGQHIRVPHGPIGDHLAMISEGYEEMPKTPRGLRPKAQGCVRVSGATLGQGYADLIQP